MGKKGNRRKTRWRVLPIGGEEGDCAGSPTEDEGEAERVSGSPTSQISGSYARAAQHQQQRGGARPQRSRGGGAGAYHRHRTYHDTKQPLVTTEKKTFNEEEYTKITTPRQDVLFKKGYLGRKRPVVAPSNPAGEGAVALDEHAMHNGGHMEMEHQHPSERVEMLSPADEPPQMMYTNGYMDQGGGVFYINGSYDLYDPYTGNLTTVVVGPAPHYAGPSGGPPVLAAVSCQPLPLQPIEWFNPAYMPAPAYMAPACPRERRKRSSTDSQGSCPTFSFQNCSPQSSESTEAPGSPQIGEEVAGLPNGEKWTAEVQTVSHPTYMYPGYMFGPPVYNMNGITVQGVPPQPQSADTSGSKRRKKKRRRRRRRGGVDDGSEESTSDEKELEEPASLTSHASSQELESDSRQSAGSAYFLTVNGGKEYLPEDRLTEEKTNSLETSRALIKTGEDNIINDYSGVNGDGDEREVSLTFEVNGSTEEVTTSNSATSNDLTDIQPDFVLCANGDTNYKALRAKEENIEVVNESLSNSIADRELVLKNNVSNPVFNTELSTAECDNTINSDKPLPGSPKSVSYKDVICNNQSDCKNVKGDTQSVVAKEKVKSKKTAKLLKQKPQSIVSNGYGELQMTNVQSQTFVSKMDGNEVAGSVATLDKRSETPDLAENVSTKSEVSAIQVTEQEICGSTSTLADCSFNGAEERNILPPSEAPKKPQRKERQVQLNQQHKLVLKEDSLKANVGDLSRQSESSKQKSNSKRQPNTSGVSAVECPKTRSSTNLEDIGHKGSAPEESSSLPKTINKSFKGGDHKPTALSEPEPSPSLHETSYDSSVSKVSFHNSQRKSGLGETRAPHTEDALNECEDRKFQTPINDLNVLTHEKTDIECILVETPSSLTSSKVCSSQEGNKPKSTSDKHINKRNPCVDRIEHSPELQEQSKTPQKQSKNNVQRNTPPPIPPPRRKKWQPTNKRSSLERPPTPGRDLESNRCSEVLTDESCSSSTSHESEESVIELLSPTSSPDSKVVERAKELSSDDEEGVIFGSKDVSKPTTDSFIDSEDSKSPFVHKFKLDTVYETKTCDRTKTGPDKEVDFTKKCKFLPETVEVSVSGEMNSKTISNPLQKDTVTKSDCTQRFRYNSDCQTIDKEQHVSLSVVESFADVMSHKVLTEALSEDRTLMSAKIPQLSTLPITEAVTRWLNSQSTEKALCLPNTEELDNDCNDEYDDEDGAQIDEVGENMTGQKNVLRNPLPVLSLKCTDSVCDNGGRRVASFENINDLVNSNYENKGSRFQKCGNMNDIIVSNESSSIVDNSITSECKNSLQAAKDSDETEQYIKRSSVSNANLNTSCSDNISKTDKYNATVDLEQLNTREKSNEHFQLNNVCVEDNDRNRHEECNSSFTSESIEYDAEWECDLLAPSALIGGAILFNNDDSNVSVESPDNHRSYMCDPTVSVSKYYRLGTSAEKITTMVQEEESSETETEEEVDALKHFRNELDSQDNSGQATLADELLCSQEPLPDSWAIEPIKITEKVIEDKVPQNNADIYRDRYAYYKASDSHIQLEESGNEAMIETGTGTSSINPLSKTASALHRKSTLLLSHFGGDGPVPCGGICCILQ